MTVRPRVMDITTLRERDRTMTKTLNMREINLLPGRRQKNMQETKSN
jgi:hypothetical protein